MKDDKVILILVGVSVETSLKDGRIQSKSASQSYRDNFDGIFKKSQASATLN